MSEFRFGSKLNHYRKQLENLYGAQNESLLQAIISSAAIHIQHESSFDNWNGGTFGHVLKLFIGNDLYSKISSFEHRDDLATRICIDVNKASTSIVNENIDTVYIELIDTSDTEFISAIQPNDLIGLTSETTYLWKSDHLKLFVSHKDTHKAVVSQLASELERYGVSCFVAHDDIEPTEQWQKEIEKALRSMDVFLAFLTDDFSSGNWTNQEVGFAIARGIPIIPLKMPKLDPYGFMGIYQGIQGDPDSISKTADLIFDTLSKKVDSNGTIKRAIIAAFVNSKSYFDSDENFKRLQQIPKLVDEDIQTLVEGYNKNN